MPNIKYLFYYHLVLEDFESSRAEYQQHNVLNSSRIDSEKFNLFNTQQIYSDMHRQNNKLVWNYSESCYHVFSLKKYQLCYTM